MTVFSTINFGVTAIMDRQKRIVIFGISFLIIITFGWVIRERVGLYFSMFLLERATPFVTVAGAISGLLMGIITYLQRSERNFKTLPSKFDASVQQQREDQKEAENELGEGGTLAAIIAAVDKSKSSKVTVDFVSQAAARGYTATMRGMFSDDLNRLSQQLATLRSRSYVNLSIGVALSLVAGTILLLMVLGSKDVTTDTKKMTAYFLSRLSTAVFVEVFAFFFLKMYKTTLEEEKFYQGEILTRSARHTALELAFQLEDKVAKMHLIQAFSCPCTSSIPAPPAASATSDVPETAASDSPIDLKAVGEILGNAAKLIGAVSQKAAETH